MTVRGIYCAFFVHKDAQGAARYGSMRKGRKTMARHFFAVILAFFALGILRAEADGAGLEKFTLKHKGMERVYQVHDPRAGVKSAPSGKRPLILVLHGGGGRAEKFDAMTGKAASFNALAGREDLLVVYPQGIDRQWNDGREVKHIAPQAQGIDDAGFLSSLIDHLVKTRNVDERRIYATGPSNGGFMSNRLACDLAGKVAAVGIVIATMPVLLEDKCRPAAPVSVLIMNGTEDPLVPFNGGFVRDFRKGRTRGEILSTAQTFDFWLRQAGYGRGGQAIRPEPLADAAPGDRTRVTRQAYKGKNAEVALYTIEGGGHTWPGGRQYLFEFLVGRTSRDINATEHIWEFFKRNPKP